MQKLRLHGRSESRGPRFRFAEHERGELSNVLAENIGLCLEQAVGVGRAPQGCHGSDTGRLRRHNVRILIPDRDYVVGPYLQQLEGSLDRVGVWLAPLGVV